MQEDIGIKMLVQIPPTFTMAFNDPELT